MPPPNSHGIACPPNRKEAIAAGDLLETPAQALARVKAGGAKPKHYIPRPPLTDSERAEAEEPVFDLYKKGDTK
jgi:hypothetical protein